MANRTAVRLLLGVAGGMLALAPALPVVAHAAIHLMESSHAHSHDDAGSAHHHGHSHEAPEHDDHSLPAVPSLDALRGATGRIEIGGSESGGAMAGARCSDLIGFAVVGRSPIVPDTPPPSSPRSSPSRSRAPPRSLSA